MTVLGGTMTETCVMFHRRDPDRPRRAAPGLSVCGGHRTAIARDLIELPGMHERLAAAHAGRPGAKSEIRAGGHAGLNLDDRVATCRAEIRTMLSTWARAVAEDIASGRTVHLPEDTVPAMARYLLGHRAATLDWILGQDWADDFAAGIDAVHRDAFGLLHPRGIRRFEVGDCIEVTSCSVLTRAEERCPGRMVATLADSDGMLPASLWCEDCGIEITAAGWITYGRRVHKAMGVAS
jgi:hypothetical protein